MVLSSSTVADGPPSPLEKAKEKDKSKFEIACGHSITRQNAPTNWKFFLKQKEDLQQALNIFILSQKFRVVNP